MNKKTKARMELGFIVLAVGYVFVSLGRVVLLSSIDPTFDPFTDAYSILFWFTCIIYSGFMLGYIFLS